MACFKPLSAYVTSEDPVSHKKTIVFGNCEKYMEKIQLPCGRCIGCRLERSRRWAIRCVHEAQMSPTNQNCFITLTYSEQHLPHGNTLIKKHFQDFMKRLRKHVNGTKPRWLDKAHKLENPDYTVIRFFHAGEYGCVYDDYGQPIKGMLGRPHYHACIFNYDFDDRIFYKEKDGIRLDLSPTLDQIWGKGFTSVGNVTFESAGYVARYIMKKINGTQKEKPDEETGLTHYEQCDPYTGEIHLLESEYTTMSRKPGIGRDWYDKYKDDCFPDDFLIHDGAKVPVPSYYREIYQVQDPEAAYILARRRIETAKASPDNTPARLKSREKCALARNEQLKRTL